MALLAPETKSGNVKVVAGEAALDGGNPTVISTGLKEIYGVVLTLKTTVAPGDSTQVLTYTTSVGELSVYAWKNISGSDPTLAASTGTDTFGYVVVGR